MPVREFPPPPPPPLDHDYPLNGYVSRGQEIVAIIVCVAIVAVFLGGAWLMGGVEKKRHAFFAKCIEFQTWDRCDTLYRYGREDLMERR